jgi:phosphotransferase system HPr (HPr) family protein
MSETKAIRTVAVSNPQGIHARAATLIADLTRRFDAKVVLAKHSERVEATEVLQILSLGAAQGEEVLLEATGHDSEQALDALVRLFADNFGENQEETEQ